jgi:hypothetical protein
LDRLDGYKIERTNVEELKLWARTKICRSGIKKYIGQKLFTKNINIYTHTHNMPI